MGNDSILTSTKKLLGIAEDYKHFDVDLIIHINSVLAVLHQLGVGPENGFSIEDHSAVWSEFMGEDPRLNLVKSYVHLKVRLLFDPPLGSAVLESTNRMVSELEWRITTVTDTKEIETEDKEENQDGQ